MANVYLIENLIVYFPIHNTFSNTQYNALNFTLKIGSYLGYKIVTDTHSVVYRKNPDVFESSSKKKNLNK